MLQVCLQRLTFRTYNRIKYYFSEFIVDTFLQVCVPSGTGTSTDYKILSRPIGDCCMNNRCFAASGQ